MQFFIAGTPKPQGSKRAFVHPSTGRAIVTESAGEPLKDWRACVSLVASEQGEKIEGPVAIDLEFILQRPKSHFGTGRNAGKVKASAPVHHDKKPDIDKLTRAVLDGLAGIVMGDDSCVAELTAMKMWADPGEKTGCLVRVVRCEPISEVQA